MEFFNSAVDTLQTIVVGLGGALCVWGGINLLEGYGQDNPGSKSQGIKQLIGWWRCRSVSAFSLSLCCPGCSAKCHPLSLFPEKELMYGLYHRRNR